MNGQMNDEGKKSMSTRPPPPFSFLVRISYYYEYY